MRNGFFREESEPRPPLRSRAAGLAVSLVLHAFLVYGLYKARMTLKILAVGPEVKNVAIVPPVRITVPEFLDDYIQGRPADGRQGPATDGKTEGRPRGNPVRPRETAGTGRAATNPAGSGLAPGNLMKNMPGVRDEDEPGLGSELALGERYRERETGRYVINLSALPDKIVDAPLGFEDGPNRPYRPLQNYVQKGRTSGKVAAALASGPGPAGGGSGGGGQRASARVEIRSPGYDISPWAKKAIDLIQINWKIPGAVRILDRCEVRIAVTIEKDGSLSAFTRLADSVLEVLNSAAAAALNSSAPLPPLPEDFPRPNLEAVFVFEYHE